ncbi:MAG TPA: mannose-6-phosphate isomerase [Bacilli bacterium]|jgi:mannose-6-phosphate isomerase|nr:MAG: putative mannose-6-phosphate isomerase GmuF [Tenericutes bacterium ADurb.Bin140]HOE77913.1 mannose-6-phosphate isomerase [Bacilli bacterium]HOR96352.1 mannose-6-phosphate isomerase [Bacilli bacterium]
MDEKVLFLRGVLKEKIWGSTYFKDRLGLTTSSSLIGELWSASGHPEGSSVIKNGPLKGKTLNEVYQTNRYLFGTLNPAFPLLVKIIATSDDLSVQVHPSDEDVKNSSDQGKAEGWLVLEAKPNSKIVWGHQAKNKQEFFEAVQNKTITELLNYYPVKKGMYRFISPGVVHSLGKGIVVLEIQQSSDTTYRIYDYDRIDSNNQKRELHLEKALEVIKYNMTPTTDDTDYLNFEEDIVLDQNAYFKAELLNVRNEKTIFNQDAKMSIVTVIEGTVDVFGHEVKPGESFIITALCEKLEIKGMGKIALIKAA